MTQIVIPAGVDSDPVLVMTINGRAVSQVAGVPFTPTGPVLALIQQSHLSNDYSTAVPAQVTGLAAEVVSDTEVTLTFNTPVGADSYEYRIDGGAAVAAASSPVELDSLTAETEYDFEVRGVNGSERGAYSSVVTVTTDAAP